MLLRRMTQHVKAQNWFAVGLDFVIVVFGVFIGLQVANWNDVRGERELEGVYVERLHQEVVALESVRAQLVRDRKKVSEDLFNVAQKLFNETKATLTDFECATFAGIIPTSNPTDDLPLITELLSSGRITILSDDELKQALSHFLTVKSRARDSRDGVVSSLPQVSLIHNHLFEVRSLEATSAADYYRSLSSETTRKQAFERSGYKVYCDIDAMRASVPFKNDLSQMVDQHSYHLDDNRRVSEALAALHRALDDIVGEEHEEEPL